MHVYLSVDMEGVAGVVHVDQTRRGGGDYEQARRWMTAEANAAIAGAWDAGATAVLVNDSHGDMRNLLLDALDARAEVLTGALKPYAMVQGAGAGHGVALFVGYHAGAGTRASVLDHTYFGKVVTGVRVGGEPWDEAALNAAVLGVHGVPVGLVTGDAAVCRTAHARFPGVETVAVKESISRYAARCLPLALARERIREGAEAAVSRAREGALRPFRPAAPLTVEVDYVNSACADVAELVPGTERTGGLTTRYTAPDALVLLRVVRAWTTLGGTVLV